MSRTNEPKPGERLGHLFGFPPGLVEAAREQAMRARARQQWERESSVLLVPDDRLYFRLERAGPGAPPARADEVRETFRREFCGVWGRIPRADRDLLLRYWRGGPVPAGPLYAHPTIRVIEVVPWATAPPRCVNFASELSFTLAEVTERPDHLPSVIATALAQALLHANRHHWDLALEFIEQPLARWERRQGKKADDAERDSKIDKLEQAHHKAY